MEIQGKIIVDLGETTGTSKAGNPWKKHEYVLETKEQYPRKVHFDFFGDRADQYRCAIGDDVTLSFDIESREYNGRWFTSIRGWKLEKAGSQPEGGASGHPQAPFGPNDNFPGGYGNVDLDPANGSPTDDLPF